MRYLTRIALLTASADRVGTFTHSDYQRRGLATWLTQHCNAIADAEGGRTWVNAVPASKNLFESNDFDFVGSKDYDLRTFGGSGSVTMETFRRDPNVINA